MNGVNQGDDRIVRAGDDGCGPIVRRVVRGVGGPAPRPWEATGSIEVEALCVWAYRDQRVDRDPHQGMHTIEVEASGGLASRWSTDGCAALGRIAHMGCRVETFGVTVMHNVHPAADAVASVLAGIDGGREVAHYARQAGRPGGWDNVDVSFRPVVWIKGGAEAHWERGEDGARYCPLIVVEHTEHRAKCRAAYERWWDALDQLAWALSMRALGFAVLRPTAPRQPWTESA